MEEIVEGWVEDGRACLLEKVQVLGIDIVIFFDIVMQRLLRVLLLLLLLVGDKTIHKQFVIIRI